MCVFVYCFISLSTNSYGDVPNTCAAKVWPMLGAYGNWAVSVS